MEPQPLGGTGALIIEDLKSDSDTLHPLGFFWTSDQSNAEASIGYYTTVTTDRYSCPWWDSNPQSQQANCRRLTP